MKYCVDYKRDFKYLQQADELTITYNRKDTSLLDFLLLYKDKRINIYIENEEDFIQNHCIQFFDAIASGHPEINFVFKLRNYRDEAVKKLFLEIVNSKANHKYFFETLVSNWDVLYGYLKLKPSDMYIVEDLGFELDKVAEILHEKNIQVRCFPNIAQSQWEHTPALKQFFIRPDDVYIYEKCVDVFEFLSAEKNIETYFRIYAIEQQWFGKLNEVIIGFRDDVDSRYIVPLFAERRMRCGKRCLKGRPCNICESIKDLSEVLKENEILVSDLGKAAARARHEENN